VVSILEDIEEACSNKRLQELLDRQIGARG